jgi:ABC-2 type transport system ATP-binding protein
MSYIELKNISKRYGDRKAVDNVSLRIEKGELFGLLGPNGAGKSTAISMMTTLTVPDTGEITIQGFNTRARSMEVKKILGLVPQEIALYPTLTARENLSFWGRMYGLGGSELKQRVEEVLEIAGLQDRAKHRIDTYSGGMKRRINIAAAMLHKPEILIMDEPTVGIDPQSRNHILETVLKLNKEGITVIYTSHYMEEVEFLCSRIAIMDLGKVIAEGSREELRKLVGDRDTIHISVSNISGRILDSIRDLQGVNEVSTEQNKVSIIAREADTVLARIISIFDSARCKIHAVNVEQTNLESVFLHLTGRALRD